MTFPIRLAILNNKDDTGNSDNVPECGFGIGGVNPPPVPPPGTIPGVSTPYVGYWKLLETEGSEAEDYSENLLPMEYVGGVELGTKNAAFFNGSSAYALGENTAMYDTTTAISVVAYFRIEQLRDQAAIVSKWGVEKSWGLFHNLNGTLQFVINGGSGIISVDTFTDVDTVYKVIVTYDGTTTKLYVNDVSVSFTGTLSGEIQKTTENINISRKNDGSAFFIGWLRDIYIYRYALSETEILEFKDIEMGGV